MSINWPLIVFLVSFFSIVFIAVIIDMVCEKKNKGKKKSKESSFTISGHDNEYPWPSRGWPFL